MNILLINGSPRGERSNTLKLASSFIDGICAEQSESTPDVKRLDIAKMNIRPCLGCFSCWNRTPGKCCIQDDMQSVIEALLWADITIWSFPLYYFSLPGNLKTVIDRQLPMVTPFMVEGVQGGGHSSRYDMSRKRTVLISTCGFYTADTNYNSVTAQFDRICGKGGYTTVFCGEGELFSVPELSDMTGKYLETVRLAGREYITGGIKEETSEKLQQSVLPRDVFEQMADASWGVSETGEKQDPSLIFTKQMAALYNPASYRGSDYILDMDYTDIGKCYRIVLGKSGSSVVEEFTKKATTVIHTPFSVWKSIAAGEIEGAVALMQHQYSVEGDFDIMLKWDDYFGSPSGETVKKKQVADRKTNMSYLLVPWIVFWVAASINSFWGSALSLLTCCLLPLIFFKSKRTVYDVISGALVGAFSILMLAGQPEGIIMPISYISFGLMWSLSAFLKIPLTAEYSMNDYGGDAAFKNPIFIKTNRILTAAWGVLYIIIPIVTYFIAPVELRGYFQIANYIIPVLMGIFTSWFQNWYPRKVARG